MKRVIEWILASGGAGICVGGAAFSWQSLARPVSPLAALYLMEMAVLGVLGLIGVAANVPPRLPRWGWVAWRAAGAILAFAGLGAWTVGLQFLPAGIAFLGAGLLADRRRDQSLYRHLDLLVLAALLQAGFMFGVIVLVSSNVQWE